MRREETAASGTGSEASAVCGSVNGRRGRQRQRSDLEGELQRSSARRDTKKGKREQGSRSPKRERNAGWNAGAPIEILFAKDAKRRRGLRSEDCAQNDVFSFGLGKTQGLRSFEARGTSSSRKELERTTARLGRRALRGK